MSNAINTAGMVGRFGVTSFTSVRDLPGPLPPRPKNNRFFKSRPLNDVVEEEEEVGAVSLNAEEAGR